MKKKRFQKSKELDSSSCVKNPSRSNAILKIESIDNYCFLSSVLAYLHPCENSHPSRVRKNRLYFNELNIEGFNFTNGFKCSDVREFAKLNNLNFNLFELNSYQDQNKRKHTLIPIAVSENDESDRVVELIIDKNDYALIKKLNVFLGNHNKIFICRRCLNS